MKTVTLYFDDLTAATWQIFNNTISDSRSNICRVRVSSHANRLPEYEKLLQPEEIIRANSFYHEADRNRSIVSRAVLKKISGLLVNRQPQLIEVVAGINKKPIIRNAPGLHFNISHSNDCIVIAFSDSSIGVDVEFVNEAFDYNSIMRACFALPEINLLDQSPFLVKDFYKLWTRKEAILKATGKGVNDEMDKLSCLNGIQSVEMIPGAFNNYKISSLEIERSYILSIAYAFNKELIFYDVL